MASFFEARGFAASTERVSQPFVPDGIAEFSIDVSDFIDVTTLTNTHLRVVLDGDVAYIRGCAFDFFAGNTPSDEPFLKVIFAERDAELVNSRTCQPGVTDALASSAWTWTTQPPPTSASQPSVETRSPNKKTRQTAPTRQPRNALTHGVAEGILKEMREWYENRQDDEDVTNAWKHLHKVLFKKVRVRLAGDICDNEDDTEQGVQMVVSAKDVALQVKNVIERREQYLKANNLPLDTIMNEDQKEAFLKEVEEEYHNSD